MMLAAAMTESTRVCKVQRQGLGHHTRCRVAVGAGTRQSVGFTEAAHPYPLVEGSACAVQWPGLDRFEAGHTDEGLPKGYGHAILYQAFGWDSYQDTGPFYETVQSQVAAIASAGITHLWLPPPSQSVSKQGYMPGQLYNLATPYGDQEQLKGLIAALRDCGIAPVADIVINHRCADDQDEKGVWNHFRDDVDHRGNKIDWGKWAITCNDPDFGGTGNPDTGADYGPAPDLDHANPKLRHALIDWMSWLHEDIGFSGWRFDFAKGYAAEFVPTYVVGSLGEDHLCVAEYWADLKWNGSDLDLNQNAARQEVCDWLDASNAKSAAFDFTTKGILQEALKNGELHRLRDEQGKAPGLMGWWPERAVTFIDNHDTGSSQQHWPFPEKSMMAGYAYIMTHPGIPCVFCEHFADDKLRGPITELGALRRRNNLDCGSKLEIQAAEPDLYVAKVDDQVVLKLGSRMDMGDLVPKESDGWKLGASGDGYAVWERA